jgi:hypothetical protein
MINAPLLHAPTHILQVLAFAAQQLLGAVSFHESWSSEVSYTLPRPLLAKCLFNGRRNLPKLWYLAMRGLAHKSPLEDVIMMDHLKFYDMYGRTWVKWLSRNRRWFNGWSAGDVAYGGWRQEVAQVPSSSGWGGLVPEALEADSSGEEGEEEGEGSDARRQKDLQLLQQLLGNGEDSEEEDGEEDGEEESLPEAAVGLGSSDGESATASMDAEHPDATDAQAAAGEDGAGFQFPMTWLSSVGQAQGAALAAERLYGSQEGSLLVWPRDFLAAGRQRGRPRR